MPNTLDLSQPNQPERTLKVNAFVDVADILDKYHLRFDMSRMKPEMYLDIPSEEIIKTYKSSSEYKIFSVVERVFLDELPEAQLDEALEKDAGLEPNIARSLAKNIQEHILSKKEKYFGEEVEEEKPKLKIPRPIGVGLEKENPIRKEVTGGKLELETKSPEPSAQPKPATPDNSMPPLDLRKMPYERPEPPPDEGFPGEIIHHGDKEEPSPSEAAEKPAEDMEKPKEPPEEPWHKKPPMESAHPKIEPVKRYTPPEKDIYLEQVGEGGKDEKPEKDRGTIDLSKS